MSETTHMNLNGVAETLLITLYARATESKRPDALLRDEKAVAMVEKMDYDFSRLKLQGHDIVAVILRLREFDRLARDFLARHPEAVVVHIGCGLDTRFERVDNGRVEWYDLDLPEVVELRRKLIPDEGGRYHLLSGSVLDYKWLEELRAYCPCPFLFMAEGVFPYFEEAQVKTLFLTIQKNFPGAEIVCDAQTPFIIWANNLQLAVAGVKARLHWGLKHGKDVETWGNDTLAPHEAQRSAGVRLLDEYFFFDTDEPRMRPYRWMSRIQLLGRSTGIFHYQLGSRP